MIRRLLLILIGICSCLVLFFLFVPSLFNSYLAPRLTPVLPFEDAELQLIRLTPEKAELSASLGSMENSAISLPRLEVQYSPESLRHMELESITLISPSIFLQEQDGNIILPGITTNKTTSKSSTGIILPASVRQIELQDARLSLKRSDGSTLTLTLNGSANLQFSDLPQDNNKKLSKLTLQCITSGLLDTSIQLKLQESETGYTVKLQASIVKLSQLKSFLKDMKLTSFTGQLELVSDLHLDPQLDLKDFSLSTSLKNGGLSTADLKIEAGNKANTTVLHITGNSRQAEYQVENLTLTSGISARISAKGAIDFEQQQLTGKTTLDITDQLAPLDIQFEGKKEKGVTALDYRINLEQFQHPDYTLKGLKGYGSITSDATGLNGDTNLSIESLLSPPKEVGVQALNLTLPFSWPAGQQVEIRNALLSASRILFRDNTVAKFNAKGESHGGSFSVRSELDLLDQPGFKVHCATDGDSLNHVTSNCNMAETVVRNQDFPEWLELPDDIDFSGNISFSLHSVINETKLDTSLVAHLRDGRFSSGENQITGIQTDLYFPYLPALESDIAQLLTIDSMQIGRVAFSNAKIRYRIENDHSLFIEKAKTNWCSGSLESGSIRFTLPVDEIETTLYCDRLNFSQLLDQFGISDTSGDGSLNGKLPVILSSKGIQFDDGFLFSTPGNSGIVRFNNTGQLRQGLGAAAESASLDYTMQAMEDFSYNWTRLTFNSDQGELLLNMELDGKPTFPLPFGYVNGQIAPITQGQGIQHPIRLDVNFRLPLEEMFRYGKDIQSIMENM